MTQITTTERDRLRFGDSIEVLMKVLEENGKTVKLLVVDGQGVTPESLGLKGGKR